MIIDLCKLYQFSFTVIPIDYVFKLTPPDIKPLDQAVYSKFHDALPLNQVLTCERDPRLQQCLRSVSPGFQADLVWAFKKHLLTDFCLSFNFKRVLLATSGHTIATKMLG